ncbi:MAG: flagellar protein FlgN [Myxococcota bacterium]
MNDLQTRLLVILDAEESLYGRLRDSLQEEREVVARLDAAGLEEIARLKEELSDEGRLLEESRRCVADELAASLGMPAGSRLGAICDRIGASAEPLAAAQQRLSILVSVVRELLEANVLLAGESLSEVRSTLRLIGGLAAEPATYQPDRLGTAPAEAGRLVRRSA